MSEHWHPSREPADQEPGANPESTPDSGTAPVVPEGPPTAQTPPTAAYPPTPPAGAPPVPPAGTGAQATPGGAWATPQGGGWGAPPPIALPPRGGWGTGGSPPRVAPGRPLPTGTAFRPPRPPRGRREEPHRSAGRTGRDRGGRRAVGRRRHRAPCVADRHDRQRGHQSLRRHRHQPAVPRNGGHLALRLRFRWQLVDRGRCPGRHLGDRRQGRTRDWSTSTPTSATRTSRRPAPAWS